jgi:hypothetical protein
MIKSKFLKTVDLTNVTLAATQPTKQGRMWAYKRLSKADQKVVRSINPNFDKE